MCDALYTMQIEAWPEHSLSAPVRRRHRWAHRKQPTIEMNPAETLLERAWMLLASGASKDLFAVNGDSSVR